MGVQWGGVSGSAAVLGTGTPRNKRLDRIFTCLAFFLRGRRGCRPLPPRETAVGGRCPFKRRGQDVATETAEALLGEAPGSGPGRSGGEFLGGLLRGGGVLGGPWGERD